MPNWPSCLLMVVEVEVVEGGHFLVVEVEDHFVVLAKFQPMFLVVWQLMVLDRNYLSAAICLGRTELLQSIHVHSPMQNVVPLLQRYSKILWQSTHSFLFHVFCVEIDILHARSWNQGGSHIVCRYRK